MLNEELIITYSYTKLSSIACSKTSINEGWHLFEAETYNPFPNDLRVYSAGYLEGYIYSQLINYHYTNTYLSIFNNKPLNEQTNKYVMDQFNYIEDLVQNNKKYNKKNTEYLEESSNNFSINEKEVNDIAYLETLGLVLQQYYGLKAGYDQGAIERDEEYILDQSEFYFITMQADLEDIVPAFEPEVYLTINL